MSEILLVALVLFFCFVAVVLVAAFVPKRIPTLPTDNVEELDPSVVQKIITYVYERQKRRKKTSLWNDVKIIFIPFSQAFAIVLAFTTSLMLASNFYQKEGVPVPDEQFIAAWTFVLFVTGMIFGVVVVSTILEAFGSVTFSDEDEDEDEEKANKDEPEFSTGFVASFVWFWGIWRYLLPALALHLEDVELVEVSGLPQVIDPTTMVITGTTVCIIFAWYVTANSLIPDDLTIVRFIWKVISKFKPVAPAQEAA